MALIYGDPLLNPTLSGKEHAKNQTLVGIDNEGNLLIGDVDNIVDGAKGGNDVLIGGHITDLDNNSLYGDAVTIGRSFSVGDSTPRGGNDILIGGNYDGSGFPLRLQFIFGDAHEFFRARGGEDVLRGGSNSGSGTLQNVLWGDADDMFIRGVGGNDVLIGGNSTGSGVVQNGFFGDARIAGILLQGGNDTLIAGTQSGGGTVMNFMWGDWQMDNGQGSNRPGHDTFVFDGNFGNQTYVEDLHQGEDVLDIVAAHGLGLGALTITQNGSDTLVHLTSDPNNVITLVGFTGTLTQSDFVSL